MAWRVTKRDVEFFREDLWKDLRPFPISEVKDVSAYRGGFRKDCFTPQDAQREYRVMQFLNSLNTESRLCPLPLGVNGPILFLERVQGIRVFDLVRLLRTIEYQRRDNVAWSALDAIMGRCEKRLAEIQIALVSQSDLFEPTPYPLEKKLDGLISLFVRILGLRVDQKLVKRELASFAEYWHAECGQVPFRDATTKNILLGVEALDPGLNQSPEERIRLLESLLESGSLLNEYPLYDIDFSSVVNTTSFEDDPLSLFFHERTFGTRDLNPANLVLSETFGPPSARRTAATIFVRYLRFGGRKLAYRIMNSQGFEVRFEFDDPLWYFEKAPTLCAGLSADFANDYPYILEVVDTIGRTVRNGSDAERSLRNIDWFRRYYPNEAYDYWQENPGEA